MKVHDVTQGSPEWKALRLGIPTCSRFSDILTPKTLKPSSSATKYVAELCAEWMLGSPLVDISSGAMDRGTEMEDEACESYFHLHDDRVRLVGFVTNDEGTVGGSPDALVGDDGGLEIKVPMLKTHAAYLISDGLLARTYWAQVQGYLWLTGREWWDVFAYHPNPGIPNVLERVTVDERWQSAFHGALELFDMNLAVAKERLRELGVNR